VCVIDGEGRLCISGKEILNTKSTKTSSIDIKPTVEVYQHRAVWLTLKVFQRTSLFLKKPQSCCNFLDIRLVYMDRFMMLWNVVTLF